MVVRLMDSLEKMRNANTAAYLQEYEEQEGTRVFILGVREILGFDLCFGCKGW